MKSVNPNQKMPLRNKKRHPLLLFLVIASVTFFVSEANLFETFLPRVVGMHHNKKLIFLHGLSEAVIFLSCAVVGAIMFRLYHALSHRGFPFSQYAYWFAGFIFFGGMTHFMSLLDLLTTYYWIDGIMRLLAAWFSVLVCIAFVRDYPNMKNIMTPKEMAELSAKYDELLKRLDVKEEGKK